MPTAGPLDGSGVSVAVIDSGIDPGIDPHITGIVAQLFQADPTATPAQIEDALKSTAYPYADGAPYQPAGGYSTSFDQGTGLVDVVAAATALGATGG